MIDDRLVVIKKENSFDKGWALFTPCQSLQLKNINYHPIGVDAVVKKITYADEILIILKEKCLPRKVVEELKWVCNDAKIYIVSTDRSIVDAYSGINFAGIKIENAVPIDYVSIKGQNGRDNFIVSNGFHRVDDAIDMLLQSKKAEKTDLSLLDGADSVCVCGEIGSLKEKEILDFCKNKGITSYVVKETKKFCKADYDKYYNTSAHLIVSDVVSNGVCISKKNKLYSGVIFKGKLILVETENFDAYFSGRIYTNSKCNSMLEGDSIPNNVYVFCDGDIRPLQLSGCHIIERKLKMPSMADFLRKNFDCSEIENHNLYSSIAKTVEYRFTLIPPLITKQFVRSDIYSEALSLLAKWKNAFSIPAELLKKDMQAFQKSGNFVEMLNHIEKADMAVKNIIENYKYKNYKPVFEQYKRELEHDDKNLIEYCKDLHYAIVSEICGFQNNKIEDEIKGYERTIREKEKCISQNIAVLQNKRRVEILRQKIQDLEKIKESFSVKQIDNRDKMQIEFVNWCNSIIGGEQLDEIDENSVSMVLNKERNKSDILHSFLKQWLKQIKDQLEELVILLSLMSKIDVPEDYIVYDFNKKKYIVIDSEEEYFDTLPLQKKYGVQTVTRR